MKENILLFVTDRLAVRRLIQDDAELLYKYSREESHKELPNDIFDSLEDAESRLDLAISNYRIEHLPVYFGVVKKEGNILIGVLSFKRRPDYNIQINISIAEEYQSKGYGTELVKAAAEYAKHHFGIDAVYACPRSTNVAARSTLDKAGFMLLEEKETDWFGSEQPVCVYQI